MDIRRENSVIVSYVQKFPALYDRNNVDSNNEAKKNQHFAYIAATVNDELKLQPPLTGDQVKRRWENVKKTFKRHHKQSMTGSKPNYYLYDKMKFLTNHCYFDTSKAPIMKSGDNNMKDLNNENSDEELSFKDIKHFFKKSKKENTENESENEKVVPQPDPINKIKLHNKQSLEANLLETIKKASNAIDITFNDPDADYIEAIEEALKTIPTENSLECVNGIMQIITRYINNDKN